MGRGIINHTAFGSFFFLDVGFLFLSVMWLIIALNHRHYGCHCHTYLLIIYSSSAAAAAAIEETTIIITTAIITRLLHHE